MNNDVIWAWLAGLFEGEGTVVSRKNGLCLRIGMTDEDVVKRCLEVTEMGSVVGPYERRGNKPMWYWSVGKREDAIVIVDHILPHLGLRRSERIKQLVGALGPKTGPGEHFRRQTHCKWGHPFDENNTYQRAGRRECRTCRRQRHQQFRSQI